MDAQTQSDDWVDFEQFLDLPVAYGDEYSASATVSPDLSLSYDAETLGNDLPDFSQSTFPDMINYDTSDQFLADQSPIIGMMADTPIFDDEMFNAYQPYENAFSFRQMVETQAAADPRTTSIKEKRREAAIALHLQRLCDDTARDLDMSSDSNTSFSSPSWSEYMRESISPQPASFASPEPTPAPAPAPTSSAGTGGFEMVLDLNMNATTNVPKKQKPRSQAQKENYIKARKYGACEKHKKQHKRCNCLEKAAARAAVSDVPLTTIVRERSIQPVLQKPVLPDVRSSGVPGHDPSLAPRLSTKMIKRPTNSSPEHDPSRGLCAVLPTVRTTKQSDVAGHDRQYSVPGVTSVVTRTKESSVAGHDRGKFVPAVLVTTNKTGKRSSNVPGYYSQSNVPAISPVSQGTGSLAGLSGQENSSQQASVLRSVNTSRDSSLRWRTVGSVPVVSRKENRDKNVLSATSRNARALLGAVLQVRHPDTGIASNFPECEMPVNVSFTHNQPPRNLQNSKFVRRPGTTHQPALHGRQQSVDILSTTPTIGSKQALASQPVHSRPSVSAMAILALSSGQVLQSIASEVGGLLSSVISTISGAWHSSSGMSFASRSENFILNTLSFCGARMMSVKRGLSFYKF